MGTREVASTLEPRAAQQAGNVVAVNQNRRHGFSKPPVLSIQLLAGLGAAGDAHCGSTVQHLYRKRRHPLEPNLRQVHLVHEELYAELAPRGLHLGPGELGENITTSQLDLLHLPAGTHLHLGAAAILQLTGLRDPCVQMDRFRPGLMAATLARDAAGGLVRKAGVMSIVIAGGEVRAGDAIRVVLPPPPHRALGPV